MITNPDEQVDVAAAWRAAGAAVVHKMLGELSFERFFEPEPCEEATPGAYHGWRLRLPGDVVYTFRARRGAFGSWAVAPGSATRSVAGAMPVPADDPRTLVLDARPGLSRERLAEVLTALTATVANEATRLRAAPSAEKLSTMDYDLAEGHLTGQPDLVLDKARLGFSAADRARYAPESGEDIQLRWFAVRREHARFHAIEDLSEHLLLLEELDPEQRAEFTEVVAEAGEPADYLWLPVHPWQADEIVGTFYAGELATGAVLDLGLSHDHYRPHQTPGTLANVSRPTRRDVRTALSIRDTPADPEPAVTAGPAVTTWLKRIGAGDDLLTREYRFELLGEVAGVAVRHPLFGEFPETLGAVWREPLQARLADGEQAVSFAALPERDPAGHAVITELIRRSGQEPARWLGGVLDLALTPLLHWLVRHGVAFRPDGRHLILIVDEHARPLRVVAKVFAHGVDLLDARDLDDEAGALLRRVPAERLAHSLSAGLFSGQLRFWAEILLDDLDFPRTRFWDLVREVVDRYRARNPEAAQRLDACRVTAPDVEHALPNRAQLSSAEVVPVRVPNPLHAADPAGAW
ncbi:MAG TPA: IucA/IucC family protein [Amycolatopsis sp.]|nr:IucA/IucC family protein [Amycolatopsis sp.]